MDDYRYWYGPPVEDDRPAEWMEWLTQLLHQILRP